MIIMMMMMVVVMMMMVVIVVVVWWSFGGCHLAVMCERGCSPMPAVYFVQ